MSAPPAKPIGLAFAALLSLVGCEAPPCEEPDPRGAGQEGDPCETIRDCAQGLLCLGLDAEAGMLCSQPSGLPGGADPGCLEHPDDWPEHASHGTEPPSTDEDGCELLVFISGCDCVDSPVSDACHPVIDLFREETWRRCNGCCWRLVSFWLDEELCEGD